MTDSAIHIAPDDAFDDWIVTDEDGQVLGHFPTREAAELFIEPVARQNRTDIIVHLPDGSTRRKHFGNGWSGWLFRR